MSTWSNQKEENEEVKTLKSKLLVLSNAFIQEREKLSNSEKKNKELQSYIDAMEREIAELYKEKDQLQNQLYLENKNNGHKMFNASPKEEERLNERMEQLSFENEILKKRLDDTQEQNENNKIDYNNKIQSQNEKIKKLEEEKFAIQRENYELKKKQFQGSQNSQGNQLEREHFEELLQNLQREKNEAINSMKECMKKLENLTVEAENYREAINQHQINNGKLAQKLAEYKNLLLEANLRIQIYHVTKLGSFRNKEIDIIFGRSTGISYVMKIIEDKKEEMINIEDVEYVKSIEKGKVEISYMHKSKKYVITVLVNELVVDQFIQAYIDFYSKSIKVKNKLVY